MIVIWVTKNCLRACGRWNRKTQSCGRDLVWGSLNVSEFEKVCDLSRTTIYKYISLLEG